MKPQLKLGKNQDGKMDCLLRFLCPFRPVLQIFLQTIKSETIVVISGMKQNFTFRQNGAIKKSAKLDGTGIETGAGNPFSHPDFSPISSGSN